MKARQMIEGAAFGPEALRVMGQALDEAWDEVAGSFDNEIARHAARLVLADAILAKATSASWDVEELKYAGRRALVLKYPWRSRPLTPPSGCEADAPGGQNPATGSKYVGARAGIG